LTQQGGFVMLEGFADRAGYNNLNPYLRAALFGSLFLTERFALSFCCVALLHSLRSLRIADLQIFFNFQF